MCLILVAFDYHPRYRLIVAANRDELYDRPTAAAGFWQDYPDIMAGRDLLQMGTWLGLAMTGRFGAVTNYRDPTLMIPNAKSRGELVSRYLQSNLAARQYLTEVQKQKDVYNGFNLLMGDSYSLYYYAKTENRIRKLEQGIYGLSNHLLDTPWPKIIRGKKALHKCLLDRKEICLDSLFALLADDRSAQDKDLPNTGIGLKRERLLSSIFIAGRDYGTRSSTVITIDRSNHALFVERSFTERTSLNWEESRYEFDLMV